MAFSPFGGGPITIDHENVVKAYSASPSMLGRGHTLLEPQGPIWVRCVLSFLARQDDGQLPVDH